jgi:hypothetical protein
LQNLKVETFCLLLEKKTDQGIHPERKVYGDYSSVEIFFLLIPCRFQRLDPFFIASQLTGDKRLAITTAW